MDPREWFDEGTYSDLTIKLSNGADVKVHKVIVCRLNEYFRKLCGPESHFAESKQHTIELKDDDPIALTNVLRFIYDLDVEKDFSAVPAWRFWLNLRTTADKYLVPKLSEQADAEFRKVADASTEADEIFDIMEAIGDEMAHDDSLVALAESMRKEHFGILLRNERYRAKLDNGGKEALWQVVDELAFFTGLERKRYHLCDQHEGSIFQEPSKDKQLEAECAICKLTRMRQYGVYTNCEQRVAWVE